MGYSPRLRTPARPPVERRNQRRVTPGLAGVLCVAELRGRRIALKKEKSYVVPLARAGAHTDPDSDCRRGRGVACHSLTCAGSIQWRQQWKWLRPRASLRPWRPVDLAAAD